MGMKSARAGVRQSLFYRDLASPISPAHRAAGQLVSPGGPNHYTAALWREGTTSISDPPPPPVFTLEDRVDFSPETGIPSETPGTPRTPPSRVKQSILSPSPRKSYVEKGTEETFASVSWWLPKRSVDGKGRGSPVDGVVHPGALIPLPPPLEAAIPESRDGKLEREELDGDEWVTVYGFSTGETNLVLREFEKYGAILKHLPGPRDSNWMHILYQSRYDARIALAKEAVQINNALLVGVKPVDPWKQLVLTETASGHDNLSGSTRSGFMMSKSPSSQAFVKDLVVREASAVASSQPYGLQKGKKNGPIALPSRSVVSKVVDFVFGI